MLGLRLVACLVVTGFAFTEATAQVADGWLDDYSKQIDADVAGIKFLMRYVERISGTDTLILSNDSIILYKDESFWEATYSSTPEVTTITGSWKANPQTGYPVSVFTIKLKGVDTIAMKADTLIIDRVFADRPPFHYDWHYSIEAYQISFARNIQHFAIRLDADDLQDAKFKFTDWRAPNYKSGESYAWSLVPGAEISVSILRTQSSVAPLAIRNLRVYPNPCSDYLFAEHLGSCTKIVIMNSLGAIVQTIHKDGESAKTDVRDLPNGVYYLQFVAKGEVSHERFVVNR